MMTKMTKMTRAWLLSATLLLSLSAAAQQSADEPILLTIHAIRDRLFAEEKANLAELKSLLMRWDSLQVRPYDVKDLILNTWYSHTVIGFSPKIVRKEVKRDKPHLLSVYQDSDLEILKKNANIIDLINQGLLKLEYPFPLDQEASLYAELRAYDLKDSMRIAEIGAGSGQVSFLIASTFQNMEIYINDLKSWLVKYIERKALASPEIHPSNRIHVVKGHRKRTNLEGKELDMIFMRDAFHHFKKKEEMLESIRNSLQQDGLVIAVESVLDIETTEERCEEIMRKAEILSFFEANGFTCVEAILNDWEYIFKFRKK